MVSIKIKESKTLKLNKEDGLKILKGAGIAMGGALLTYGAQILPSVDFGTNTAFIAGMVSILINFAWKLIRGK